MNFRFSIAAFAALAVSILVAAPVAALTPVAVAPAQAWTIDKAASGIAFTGVQTGKEFKGQFGAFDAVIRFDPANLAGSSIVATVSTGTAKTGDKQRDKALPGADWFAASAYPDAKFTSREIVRIGEGAYEARGSLTIRDITQPLVLPFTLKIENGRAKAASAISIVRTDFGVGRGADFSTGKWVGVDVKVELTIEATAAAK